MDAEEHERLEVLEDLEDLREIERMRRDREGDRPLEEVLAELDGRTRIPGLGR